MTDERDEHVALLVNEVGFTPAQAADATSGDIDRNGAAAMLPGIIEALEQRGIPPYDEDELLESGVDTAAGHGTDKHRPGLVLTALKLLVRARTAELSAASTIDPTIAALAVADNLLTDNAIIIRDRERPEFAARVAKVIGSVAHRAAKPANMIPAPRVIAEAIFDHIDMHGWEGSADGHDKPSTSRGRS